MGPSAPVDDVRTHHDLTVHEVLLLLEQLRSQAGDLRRRVDEYNRAHPGQRPLRVVTAAMSPFSAISTFAT